MTLVEEKLYWIWCQLKANKSLKVFKNIFLFRDQYFLNEKSEDFNEIYHKIIISYQA